jgi:hypothetical protein
MKPAHECRLHVSVQLAVRRNVRLFIYKGREQRLQHERRSCVDLLHESAVPCIRECASGTGEMRRHASPVSGSSRIVGGVSNDELLARHADGLRRRMPT